MSLRLPETRTPAPIHVSSSHHIRRKRRSGAGHDGSLAVIHAAPRVARRVRDGGRSIAIIRASASAMPGGCSVTPSVQTEARWRGEPWWRPVGRCKAVGRAGVHSVHAAHGTTTIPARILAGADAQWVFGETQTDTALDAVVERLAVEVMQSLGGKRNVLELNEAHGPILFGPETQPLISPLLGKHGFELLFRSIKRQVSDVERITRRILISRVRGREVICPEWRLRIVPQSWAGDTHCRGGHGVWKTREATHARMAIIGPLSVPVRRSCVQ